MTTAVASAASRADDDTPRQPSAARWPLTNDPGPDSSLGDAGKLGPPRELSHDNPLRLWIGGDSLAGSFGPALGQTVGATGVVDATIDYKVSSGLEDQGIRDWYEHAQEKMASDDPDAVVFIIGTNDASIANTYDSNNDGVPDWEADYREKIDRMMETFVGGTRHRTVFWLGPPTLGDHDLNKGGYRLGRVMRQEAAKFAPDVVYVDTYHLFSDESGDYSRSLPNGHGEIQEMRISDGVHFSVDGAVPAGRRHGGCSTSVGTSPRRPIRPTRSTTRSRRAATTTCPASAATARRQRSSIRRRHVIQRSSTDVDQTPPRRRAPRPSHDHGGTTTTTKPTDAVDAPRPTTPTTTDATRPRRRPHARDPPTVAGSGIAVTCPDG